MTKFNWLGIDGDSFTKLGAPWQAIPIHQQSPQNAYVEKKSSLDANKADDGSSDKDGDG